MTATAAQDHQRMSIPALPRPGTATLRWWSLAIGAAASMLAVGGRWDIALGAWIAPIFLLRFQRDTGLVLALALVWAVSVLNCVYWAFQLGVPLQLSWVISAVYGTIFALPYFADRLLASRLPTIGRLLLFPAAFATVEWVMGTLSPLGTASGLRAISQTENLALLQLTALAGPYSIGFVINALGTVVNNIWERPASGFARKALAIYAAVLVLVLLGGSARLAFSTPPKDYVRMAGITPSRHVQESAREMIGGRPTGVDASIDPDVIMAATGLFSSRDEIARTDPAVARRAYAMVADDLIEGTRHAARAGAKVVIWSETAAPIASQADKRQLLAKVAEVARQEGVYINASVGQPFARNQSHLIAPDGSELWAYDKNYPVPVIEPVEPRMSPVPVAQTPFGRLSNVICFDGDFPALNRVDSDIMIIPGFDWPEVGRMHTLKAARLRAIENGYSLIRIAYHSQSAAFDRLGNVLATQDTTGPERHIMYADVPAKGSRTLYNRTGDVLGWLSLAIVLLSVAAALFRRKRA